MRTKLQVKLQSFATDIDRALTMGQYLRQALFVHFPLETSVRSSGAWRQVLQGFLLDEQAVGDSVCLVDFHLSVKISVSSVVFGSMLSLT